MQVIRDPIDIYPEYCLDDELHGLINSISVQVDQSALDQWLITYHDKANYTRLLRYFLSSTLLDLNQKDVILDVGSGDSIFASIIGDKVQKVILNDLSIEQGSIPSNVILAQQNIFSLDFAVYGITKITVGHAFEHFRGNDDIKLIELICKALPEGGRACIEPLFIGKRYLEVYSYPTNEQYDPRATPIITRERL